MRLQITSRLRASAAKLTNQLSIVARSNSFVPPLNGDRDSCLRLRQKAPGGNLKSTSVRFSRDIFQSRGPGVSVVWGLLFPFSGRTGFSHLSRVTPRHARDGARGVTPDVSRVSFNRAYRVRDRFLSVARYERKERFPGECINIHIYISPSFPSRRYSLNEFHSDHPPFCLK